MMTVTILDAPHYVFVLADTATGKDYCGNCDAKPANSATISSDELLRFFFVEQLEASSSKRDWNVHCAASRLQEDVTQQLTADLSSRVLSTSNQ